MWIVILNFCLFILLIGFMFYGFSKWTKLITEYDDGTEGVQKDSDYKKEKAYDVVDGKYYRFPLWVLLIGIGISQAIGLIQYLLGY